MGTPVAPKRFRDLAIVISFGNLGPDRNEGAIADEPQFGTLGGVIA